MLIYFSKQFFIYLVAPYARDGTKASTYLYLATDIQTYNALKMLPFAHDITFETDVT
jgi:hypothetical protein